jgi:hypothetical protein
MAGELLVHFEHGNTATFKYLLESSITQYIAFVDGVLQVVRFDVLPNLVNYVATRDVTLTNNSAHLRRNFNEPPASTLLFGIITDLISKGNLIISSFTSRFGTCFDGRFYIPINFAPAAIKYPFPERKLLFENATNKLLGYRRKVTETRIRKMSVRIKT